MVFACGFITYFNRCWVSITFISLHNIWVNFSLLQYHCVIISGKQHVTEYCTYLLIVNVSCSLQHGTGQGCHNSFLYQILRRIGKQEKFVCIIKVQQHMGISYIHSYIWTYAILFKLISNNAEMRINGIRLGNALDFKI